MWHNKGYQCLFSQYLFLHKKNYSGTNEMSEDVCFHPDSLTWASPSCTINRRSSLTRESCLDLCHWLSGGCWLRHTLSFCLSEIKMIVLPGLCAPASCWGQDCAEASQHPVPWATDGALGLQANGRGLLCMQHTQCFETGEISGTVVCWQKPAHFTD